MTKKNRLLLGNLWLVSSLSALVVPIFVPSYPHGAGLLPSSIELSTATMFVLSFPSSLFGLPFLYATYGVFGIDPYSISGMYTHLSMLFLIGLVQWFWIVPRIWFREPLIQTLQTSVPELLPAKEVEYYRFSSRDKTPVERIIDEDKE